MAKRKKTQSVEDFHREQMARQEQWRRDAAPPGFDYAGTVGVDSGQVWVGDPCYIIGDNPVSWDQYTDALDYTKTTQPVAGGMVVSSGYGDGVYSVYVRRTKEGRVAEMRIRFIGDEDSRMPPPPPPSSSPPTPPAPENHSFSPEEAREVEDILERAIRHGGDEYDGSTWLTVVVSKPVAQGLLFLADDAGDYSPEEGGEGYTLTGMDEHYRRWFVNVEVRCDNCTSGLYSRCYGCFDETGIGCDHGHTLCEECLR